ncbi:amino acid ABC transporter permease [Phyllobacterium sp. YR531]|uniref:amino acid ABC transporter permease n=1 Tax=Phyllobacterium sp. YR531 TaxID=1144343 RepID=UPI00026FBB52|nr:amino acid ABC transporter permease [Phyllobacterium sp. YR531]EJM99818.1 amine acid ABC transporter, permease protein, 3-TM region, His/Glu/Gln/Arg/opine family [Phyllobacterium sp. YR531]
MKPEAPSRSAEKADFPWWLVVAAAIAIALGMAIIVNPLYGQVFSTVAQGIWITIWVSVVAFFLASALGLALAIMSRSEYIAVRQIARFYVEIMRGVPLLVLLFYIAFVGAPAAIYLWNFVTQPLQNAGILEPLLVRDFSLLWRAIIALVLAYSAFLAEIFRAGIQSVDAGQIEAAKSLGLRRFPRFRLIVMPQATRTILPPYGNDFIAMVKDSSLVSVLGVVDITQMGKVYASGSFRFFETYSVVAYIYLILTIGLSLLLRWVERRLDQRTRY